jgi:Holliday junction resolvasome RuvABC endonuclease subunit
MLQHPVYQTQEACLVGIDPGTTSLGCAVLRFNVLTMQITGITAQTFIADKLPSNPHIAHYYGNRTSRIKTLYEQLRYMYQLVEPVQVWSEAPFINTRMPEAYGALVEVVDTVRRSVMDHSLTLGFYVIPPSNVKKGIGAKGGADKDHVRQAMMAHPEISPYLLAAYDEHSADAIAVAYCGWVSVRDSRLNNLYP